MTKREVIKLVADNHNINITFEPNLLKSPNLQATVQEVHPILYGPDSVDLSIVQRLEQIVATNGAEIPTFYSLLSAAYQRTDRYDEAVQALEDAVNKFPDYLPLLTQLAMRYIEMDKLTEARQLLGANLDIKQCMAQEAYHVTAAINYYHAAFLLCLKEEDFTAADASLKVLHDLQFDNDQLVGYLQLVFAGRMANRAFDHQHTEVPRVSIGKLDRKITFDPDMKRLLKQALDLPQTVDQALQVEASRLRDTLVDVTDLYYYRSTPMWLAWDLIDCLVMLSIHFPEAAVPIVYKHVLREEQYIDDNLDMHVGYLHYPLYRIGLEDIDTLIALLHKEEITDDAKTQVIDALVQLAIQHENLAPQIKAELLRFGQHYLERIGTGEFIPTIVITAYCGKTIDLLDTDFLPLIEPFFTANIADPNDYGTWTDLREEFDQLTVEMTISHQPQDMYEYISGEHRQRNISRPMDEQLKMDLDSFFSDPYEAKRLEAIGLLTGNAPVDDEPDYDNYDFLEDYVPIEDIPQTYKREGKKVGRNDPCPCGSGKKYKKCCL